MRQGPDQIPLLQRLLRIRNGSVQQQDWLDINARYENQLPLNERGNFSHSRTLTLMETWAEVNLENAAKLSQLEAPIAVIVSEGRGKHHSQVEKQLGQIQKGLTHLGLNNGAMGKVISILYTPNTAPPEFPQAAVVEFPAYKGEAWIPEHPTWVPIPVD